MSLFGEFVKNALSLKEKISLDKRSAGEKQVDELASLLKTARATAFGKYYDFEGILGSKDIIGEYRRRIPLHDYDKMNARWWGQQQRFPDITWPGRPNYFALTSGTTGSESKRIPVTSAFIKSMRKVGLDQLAHLANAGISEAIFESEALVISSSADLKWHDGHLEGEISGINVSNFPEWYNFFYRPGKEISTIDDWDERTDKIAAEAPEWNIGAITGIPSWVQLCLKKVISRNNVEYIDDLWPNARLFMSGGVAFDTYERSFRSLFRNEIIVVDTYLASEGFFAFGTRENNYAMRLAISHGYFFEFIPFDERGFSPDGSVLEKPLVLSIDEVEKGVDYALAISTCAGAWRYMIGDTIAFDDIEVPSIRITGRTKHWLNVVGSQLTEQKLDRAITELNNKLDIEVNEYSVSAIETDKGYEHLWALVTDDPIEPSEAMQVLDNFLKKVNKNYRVARNKALAGVQVEVVTTEQYRTWLQNDNKLGGQVKVRKVMPGEDMEEYIDFVSSLS